jgi:putative transposase
LNHARADVERKMLNFLGHKFWARGYFVTIVGRDEEVIRAYIRNQELADQQLDQLELKISAAPESNQPKVEAYQNIRWTPP